jgi:hypothetical protein
MPDAELPNTEELEEMRGKAFTRVVALTTAVYAVVLAITALGGNNATKEMLLAQQQASDQWTFYQAKVIREYQYRLTRLHLEAELAEREATMAPAAQQKYAALLAQAAEEEKRYNTEKKDIEKEAKRLEYVRDIDLEKDPYFDFAEVLLQIAIVMSSIAILSTSRPMFVLSLVLAICGTLLSVNGYMLLAKLPFFG